MLAHHADRRHEAKIGAPGHPGARWLIRARRPTMMSLSAWLPDSPFPRLSRIRGCEDGIARRSWDDTGADRAAAQRRRAPDRAARRRSAARAGIGPGGLEQPRPTAVLVHGLAGLPMRPTWFASAGVCCAWGSASFGSTCAAPVTGFGLARGSITRAAATICGRSSAGCTAAPRGVADRPDRLLTGGEPGLEAGRRGRRRPVRRSRLRAGGQPPHRPGRSCAQQMLRPENRLYDWNFVRWLRAMVDRLHRRFPELGPTRPGGGEDRSTTSTIAIRPLATALARPTTITSGAVS